MVMVGESRLENVAVANSLLERIWGGEQSMLKKRANRSPYVNLPCQSMLDYEHYQYLNIIVCNV